MEPFLLMLNVVTYAHTHTHKHKAESARWHTWGVQTACQRLTARRSNQDSDAGVTRNSIHAVTPPLFLLHLRIHAYTPHMNTNIFTPHLSAKRSCFFLFLGGRGVLQDKTRVGEWEWWFFVLFLWLCVRVHSRVLFSSVPGYPHCWTSL